MKLYNNLIVLFYRLKRWRYGVKNRSTTFGLCERVIIQDRVFVVMDRGVNGGKYDMIQIRNPVRCEICQTPVASGMLVDNKHIVCDWKCHHIATELPSWIGATDTYGLVRAYRYVILSEDVMRMTQQHKERKAEIGHPSVV